MFWNKQSTLGACKNSKDAASGVLLNIDQHHRMAKYRPIFIFFNCYYSLQLVTDGCEWNNDRGCRAWRNFDCSIYFHNQKRSYQEAWGGLSQAWEESCPSQLEHSWVHGCYRLIAWQQLRQPGGTDKNNLRSPIIQCTWKWRISAGSAGWLWWSRLYAS